MRLNQRRYQLLLNPEFRLMVLDVMSALSKTKSLDLSRLNLRIRGCPFTKERKLVETSSE